MILKTSFRNTNFIIDCKYFRYKQKSSFVTIMEVGGGLFVATYICHSFHFFLSKSSLIVSLHVDRGRGIVSFDLKQTPYSEQAKLVIDVKFNTLKNTFQM